MEPTYNQRKNRSSTRKELFGETYKEENEFVAKGKLQTGIFVIGRMLSLCKVPGKGKNMMSRDDANLIVAKELSADWIEKNVYPMEVRSVPRKIKKDYDAFLSSKKSERNISKRKSDKW